ncbi:MAG: ferrous iron transport protein A [Candidatus Thermoplasmatota archaeon]|nr:ferrous iron transport protein A [Candidatus Thermoplasmatota archaeon]MBU1941341.1 ferrous iron transport protein A [Candidatus Thermoplasmatota archaeon]
MKSKTIPLTELPVNTPATIKNINGGLGFKQRLQVMGIHKGQTIKTICKQPLKGPITINACGCQMTIGRGMAQKIEVETTR